MSLTRTVRAHWQPEEADPPLAAGAVIDGRYRVVELIGEGGMGRVYETEHLFLRRRLALKLVRRDAGTGEAAARLLQEAVLAGKVPHATVVPVFDCAALPDGQVYVAMELLRGESLEAALLRPQPAEAALRWLAEVARGLAAAHRAGIVHRDVKPANVFLARGADDSVQPRILDFGIAKLLPGLSGEAAEGVQTQAGALLGTPFYMAPERICGETGDARADLYSLGVILYEALTGRVPFSGDGFMEIVGRHLHEAPIDPRQAAPGRKIPDALAELALQLLHKQPDGRPSDGEAVAEALLAIRESAGVATLMLGAEVATEAARADAATQSLVEAPTQRLEVSSQEVTSATEGSPELIEKIEIEREEDVESDMSKKTSFGGGRWVAGLVVACAAVVGLVAWVGGRGGAVEVVPAAASGPEPGIVVEREVAPIPVIAPVVAPEAVVEVVAEVGAETGAVSEPAPEAAPEPAPEPVAGKRRGKKGPRKAGTTEPGPRESGPKIKIDVYDE